MSALGGLWRFDGGPEARPDCERMLAAQEIYGPHHGACWADGPVAMGRRLFRTLPEDLHDHQPLRSADGRLVLVADLRLDNRDELASQLGIGAAAAAELSDAAVLLASLERWGENALDHIVGDFAFVLWDARDRKLLLARDFLGQRPLHYHRGQGFFAFASMPSGLHALPKVPRAPDEQAVLEFLLLQPQSGSHSFFQSICRVEPGHAVTVDSSGLSVRRYWDASGIRPLRLSGAADYVEGLRHHLDQAVRSRLRFSGEQAGAQLSGGFDSSSVAATAARLLAQRGGRLVAFTSVPREGYDDARGAGRVVDEGPLAATTAALYPNIEHVLIRAGQRSPMAPIDRAFDLFQRPQLNLCNAVWLGAINEAAGERGISVVLNGQMGNATLSYNGQELLAELLGGAQLFRLWREINATVRQGTMGWRGAFANTFGPYLPARFWLSLSKRYRGGPIDFGDLAAIAGNRLRSPDAASLLMKSRLSLSDQPLRNGRALRLRLLGRVDLGNYNKGTLGGWGIDQRDPSADQRLVEFCLAVPTEQYFSAGVPRALALTALADRLPQAVLRQRRKGYQGADYHEGLTAARGAIAAELEQLERCEAAARTLDLPRLQSYMRDWPQTGWDRIDVTQRYRFTLLRGISAGHFMRKAAENTGA